MFLIILVGFLLISLSIFAVWFAMKRHASKKKLEAVNALLQEVSSRNWARSYNLARVGFNPKKNLHNITLIHPDKVMYVNGDPIPDTKTIWPTERLLEKLIEDVARYGDLAEDGWIEVFLV